ncbi:type II secretion system F family protein [Burkholderiaceae bacterium DAT-1]|nr:type II secretion system F family protein [Burkholderiaceae bacterium DAT-1]
MRYQAKVVRASGQIDIRELEADSRDAAEARLKTEGLHVLSVQAQGNGLRLPFQGSSFQLDVFNQQLYSLLEAGQSIVDCIDILQHNDSSGTTHHVYAQLLQSLRQGKQLSQAMAQLPTVFPPLYVALVKASETTGSVPIAVQRFMRYRQQVALIRGKLVSASIYPAILVSVGFLVIGFLMLYVVPRFSLAFDDVQNKAQVAGFVFAWGNVVREHTVLAWGAFFALIAAMASAVIHPAARHKALTTLIAIPAIGRRIRIFQLARLYRTLGLLQRSGLPLTQSMHMARASMPAYFQPPIDAARMLVEAGHPLSRALSQQQLGTEVAARLLVAGESSGNLDEMLERVADFHDQEVAGWVDMIGRIIEPALMVGIGLIIGVVVLLLYMPIFELANSVQ